MAKKNLGSSVRGKRIAKNVKHMPDRKIDYSDIAPSTDEELRGARRVGRPKALSTKQLIAIRLDPQLISKLKKVAKEQGIPYQTLVHLLLEEAVDKVA